jgi:hypothetical protein
MATKSKVQETKKPPQAPATETKELAPAMPDYMKSFMQQSQTDTGSLISSSVSVPRLSFRGKRWRFVVDGEEELIKDLAVQVIIVGVEPEAGRFIKTLYLTAYNPGDSNPPDCSSSNGIAPDVWVSSPQAPRCQSCPKNVFGSAASRTGGKAKACSDSKRLWVVRPEDADVVYGLNVPIMSLKNLAEYGKYIARNNYPLALVVTELTMDDESEFPKLCFAHTGFVKEEHVKTLVELNQRRPWKAATVVLPFDGPMTALPAPVGAAPPAGEQPRKTGGENIDALIGQWEKK